MERADRYEFVTIAFVFQHGQIPTEFLPSNEAESQFFYRYIEDAIQTEFVVRDIAIKLLKQMRARTKSDALRTQLKKLLPPSKANTNLP